MNCNQARTLLSAYRELTYEEFDTAELDAHLETCAACREARASYTEVGEQLRSAPLLTPPSDMHEKLMKALADEQLKFLQKSAPGTVVPTPEFLRPYLQERAQETRGQDEIAAFSTAETGPLPMIRTRRRRRSVQIGQLGVLGLAAAILILLMTGGLTSLLLAARNNPGSLTRTSISVNRPTEVDQKIYTTTTLYPYVTSLLPEDNEIYYSASGDSGNGQNWMLMQYDRSTQTSKPLLGEPSTEPLIILAASNNWLVWLEFSQPQTSARLHTQGGNTDTTSAPQRFWSLHYLSLASQPGKEIASTQAGAAQPGSQKTAPRVAAHPPALSDVAAPQLLAKGIFDSSTAPSWVATPVQGTWLLGDMLLIAHIDQQGISHLQSYLLGQTGKVAKAQEIASAPAGHVLAWPTADSTGMEIYWSDEWTAEDGTLHSNIWQQQTDEQALRYHGYPEEVDTHTQQLYLGDGLSFRPQVVNDTLFFLSTSEITVTNQGAVIPNGTPYPNQAKDSAVAFTPRTDPAIYPAPADASLHGTIFMIPQSGLNTDAENTLGTVGQSTAFQAGNSYIIWQNATGYQMYDVQRQSDVTLGNTLNGSSLLVVNGRTTLWLAKGKSAPDTTLTMMAFTWPN